MLNKDKRSLLLSMALGDGCIHTRTSSTGKVYGAFTITHGLSQSDYITWKAKILSGITDREINVRTFNRGTASQVSVSWKRLKAWRKFCYPNGKKSISKILPFIRHPEFAIAVWLMDDGYVEPSISTLATGEKKNYGARFRIFTCDQSLQEQENIVKWLKDTFEISLKIKIQKKDGKEYYFLKFTQEDSLKIWKLIRDDVLKIKSMKHKFRYIEQIYQHKFHSASQATA